MSSTTWTVPMPYGRILDPVRAAALHEAVQLSLADPEVGNAQKIIAAAKEFEEYLAGTDG